MLPAITALAALAAVLVGPAAAHDFYIVLDRWTVADAEAAKINAEFRVGHVADAEPWIMRDGRVVALSTVGPSGRLERNDALIFPTAGEKSGAAITLPGAGFHVIAFETDDAFNQLGPEAFNAYLAEEGLAPAIEARRAAGDEDRPGRELYSRRAKALVRVGAGAAPPALGQTLEITPLDDPFALEAGAPLRVRVDYENAPLAGATVSLESLDVGFLPIVRKKTGADGIAEFKFPKTGAWKLAVVWTKPIDDPRADFQTVFSSLTFGF